MNIVIKGLFVSLLACSNQAFATADGPDLLSVRGVASDDHLNIREAPDHRSRAIGTIPYDATSVLNRNCGDGTNKWCEIEFDGVIGHVNRRYIWESLAGSYIFPSAICPFATTEMDNFRLAEGAKVYSWFDDNKDILFEHDSDGQVLSVNRCYTWEGANQIPRIMCDIAYSLNQNIYRVWAYSDNLRLRE